jgi:tRNA pseudouridine55 synthase
MTFGCINVYKPIGFTSHDVVAKIRRFYGLKKVGHLGTLDPAAEGVLPICLGQATRLMEYFPDDKVYEARIALGRLTSTLDREGDVLAETPCPQLTQAAVEQALQQFKGEISLTVPHHAAVHFKGKKLYHYAHQGVVIPEEELPKKTHTVFSIEMKGFEAGEFPVVSLRLHCSTGTYVRSIARDLGRALGLCGGTLTYLVRSAHGRFEQDKAITLDALKELSEQGAAMPIENPALYLGMPLLSIRQPTRFTLLVNGGTVNWEMGDPSLPGNTLVLATYQATMIGVLQKEGAQWKPVKILNAALAQMVRPATPQERFMQDKKAEQSMPAEAVLS